MKLKGDETIEIPSWIGGLEKNTPIALNDPGTIADGQNLVPTQAARLVTRGGSRLVNTLHNDAGSPAIVTGLCGIWPWTSIGGLVIGYDTAQHKCYAWYMTQDMGFKGTSEAVSQVDLSLLPSGHQTSFAWTDAGGPPIPQVTELFEGVYLADATTAINSRRWFMSLNQTVPVVQIGGGSPNAKVPRFAFAGGTARELQPYCLETYNNVLFIAGYGDETGPDSPEYLRHSFLGRAPSSSVALGDGFDGFDKDAWVIVGAKGQRITAMKQGRGYLLVAKANELYRVSGAGRAYPGWQYAIEKVDNTSGMGVANPAALCYAEGYWYGIGAAGPFRSDGFDVKTMVGPRKADFNAIDNLLGAFCFYHPDRRLVLFGMHPQGTTPETYPWILWAWDTERERWQPDLVPATPFAIAAGSAIPTTTVSGPSAPPSTLSVNTIGPGSFNEVWVSGDLTASTEVWYLDLTGTWQLWATAPAGIQSGTISGLTDHQQYSWRVRHVKNGLYTTFVYWNPSSPVQTMLGGVSIGLGNSGGGLRQVFITVNTNTTIRNVTVIAETSPDGITWSSAGSFANCAQGAVIEVDVAYNQYVRARTEDTLWSIPDSLNTVRFVPPIG